MATAKQLYQLQEFDLTIESDEKALKEKTNQLGESQAVIDARSKVNSAQRRLDELRHKQRSLEWDVDDLTSKIRAGDDQLYSGRIRNPKELASLQQEVEAFKAKRDRFETALLEIMDQVEAEQKNAVNAASEFKKVETDWQIHQHKLSAEIEALKSKLADQRQKRQSHSADIDPKSLELYNALKKAKGQAVVRVEQGICRGCRISLPSSDLQQARSGNLVHCSSCGRILFLP